MTTNIEIEQARTFSLLSELPQFITSEREYVAFKGYIFTYSSFCVLLLWTLCGTNLYSRIWHDNKDNITSLIQLNPHDTQLEKLANAAIGTYISNKFRKMLKNIEPDDIEYMIDKMLDDHIAQH